MTRPAPMIITDWDQEKDDIVRLALATALHERTGRIGAWCNKGVISVVEDNDPLNVRLRMEDVYFSEPRAVFPSIELIAKIALAINAGLDDGQRPRIESYKGADEISYGVAAHKHYERYASNRVWVDELEHAYHKVAQITAPVKRRGLRP